MNKTINIITLGCAKNTVDSEQFAYQLETAGYNIIHNSDTVNFDIAFVNTCGFIADAKEESINVILDLARLKQEKQIKKIVVFGCLAQRYLNELKDEIPEVDVFSGNYEISDLLDAINTKEDESVKYERIHLDSYGHYAYLKISEGCNRNCAFCAIPLFKGRYVSRPMTDIIEETKVLVKNGVKEIILIAQDLSYYGYDKDKSFLLPELVEEITKVEGVEWVRLHYLYPFLFPEKLLSVIANNPKVCNYVDVPLQHISDKVLKAMNRGGTKQQTIELLNKFRQEIPDACIRTTILVGHPEEGEEEFEELMDFVREQKFDRLGVFTYSEEEGTRAANNFEDIIEQETKDYRAEQLMNLQSDISYKLNSQKIGKTYKVLIDRIEGDTYIGRTEFDSVEVDNEVHFQADEELEIGDFCMVEITAFDDFELYGKKI